MANTKTARDGNARGNGKSGKSRRGFAAMSPERQREIASEGGRAAHAKGTAHQFTSEEAAAAGRIGGLKSRGGRKGQRRSGSNANDQQEADEESGREGMA